MYQAMPPGYCTGGGMMPKGRYCLPARLQTIADGNLEAGPMNQRSDGELLRFVQVEGIFECNFANVSSLISIASPGKLFCRT